MSRSNLEYLLLLQPRDYESIKEWVSNYSSYSKNDLVEAYNKSDIVGILGSKAQATMLVGLRIVFLRAFEKSPILIKDNYVLSLSGQIKLKENDWEYLNN